MTNSHTLKLDYDNLTEEMFKNYVIPNILEHFSSIGFIKIVNVKVMQTRKGFHVYLIVKCNDGVVLTSMAICGLQAILGSDDKRERFNFIRILSQVDLDDDGWNVLFDSKWETSTGKLLSREVERPDLEKWFPKEIISF
jgi:hypothetical protein